MRVIAGSAKGRTLVAPSGAGTRPATDRIRETLLGILEPRIAGVLVLDLFAGAGTLGIEALSRGAAHATFVERSSAAIEALRKNIAATGFAEQASVVAANVLGHLDRGEPGGPYDVVFVDPPFADVAVLEAVLAHPALAAALAPDATVVARILRKHRPGLPEGVRVARTKEIGEEDLLFLRYERARTTPGSGGQG